MRGKGHHGHTAVSDRRRTSRTESCTRRRGTSSTNQAGRTHSRLRDVNVVSSRRSIFCPDNKSIGGKQRFDICARGDVTGTSAPAHKSKKSRAGDRRVASAPEGATGGATKPTGGGVRPCRSVPPDQVTSFIRSVLKVPDGDPSATFSPDASRLRRAVHEACSLAPPCSAAAPSASALRRRLRLGLCQDAEAPQTPSKPTPKRKAKTKAKASPPNPALFPALIRSGPVSSGCMKFALGKCKNPKYKYVRCPVMLPSGNQRIPQLSAAAPQCVASHTAPGLSATPADPPDPVNPSRCPTFLTQLPSRQRQGNGRPAAFKAEAREWKRRTPEARTPVVQARHCRHLAQITIRQHGLAEAERNMDAGQTLASCGAKRL